LSKIRKWLLRYPIFNILRSSSNRDRLHLKYLNALLWLPKSKFKNWVRSNKRLLRYSTFYILRSSSNRDRLHLKYLNALLWLPKSKFKNWVRSNKRLLRYSTFYILRSSSLKVVFIEGRLHLKDFQNMLWSLVIKA
jgi:hypothetical protein